MEFEVTGYLNRSNSRQEDLKKLKFVVIGLGEFGTRLARQLFEAGHEVFAIDQDMEKVENVSDFVTHAICLDATDRRALEAQEMEDMDVFIIAISNFEALVTTADVLKSMEVKRIVARSQTNLEYKILRMLGIHETFNPDDEAARNMREQFSHPATRSSLAFGHGYNIVEIDVPNRLAGKQLVDSGLRRTYNLNLVTIKRPSTEDPDASTDNGQESENGSGTDVIPDENFDVLGVPYGDTQIEAGDVLVLFGRSEDVDTFLEDMQ
ncbi:MAG: TrkA family potassium uptake protein [Leptospiraceae bacterium]|nr:TrkA family potassium uptake protein [Leptospiraceae bacterium]